MTDLTTLEKIAERDKVDIEQYPLTDADAVTVKLSETDYIVAVNNRRSYTVAQRKSILSHELGHIETGSFYNEKTPIFTRGKCERYADKWAIINCMPITAFKRALREGCTEPWEFAEYFNLDEQLVRKGMEYYRDKI